MILLQMVWGIKKITDVNNAEDFMAINFHQLTGCLPLSNGLLVITDGDPPPAPPVYMKCLNTRNLMD